MDGRISRKLDWEIMRIYAQREEILRAFIAKHGFNPDEAEQQEYRDENGLTHWRIVRRGMDKITQLEETIKIMRGTMKLLGVTCIDCKLENTCEFAYDAYNTDGDCLAEK